MDRSAVLLCATCVVSVLGEGLPPKLRRYLGTTNLIESPHSGVRLRTRRVTNWQGGGMVLCWAAGAFLATEANSRRIDGYRDPWMLKAALEGDISEGKEVRVT